MRRAPLAAPLAARVSERALARGAPRASTRLALLAALLLVTAVGCSQGDDAPVTSIEDLIARAETLYDRNDHNASAALYARAAELAREAGDERLATAYDAQTGVCLKMADRPAEARVLLEPALEAAREFGDQRTEGLALGNLARVEGMEGNHELAIGYMEQLAALAQRIEDPRLGVQTLEQAAMLSLTLGDTDGALERIDRALELNASNLEEDDRRDALLRQRATIQVRMGDHEGAVASWGDAAPAPAAMANQALLLADLGLHEAAGDLALEASLGFEEAGAVRRPERDDALLLSLSEHLRAGLLDQVSERLTSVLSSPAEPEALARFVALSGRLALRESRAADAVDAFARARADLGDRPEAEVLALLEAVALSLDGRPDDADALLAGQPDTLARTLLRAWLHAERPPAQGLAVDLMPHLGGGAVPDGDASLESLLGSCPVVLPSLAWATLHHHLADADRLRQAGRDEMADGLVRRGVSASLRWQYLETRRRLLGSWPEGGVPAEASAWIDAHVAGDMPSQEGLVVIVPGELLSYQVICTSSLGATTFGLPSRGDLATQAGRVSSALRSGDRDGVALPAEVLFSVLFSERARIDLADRALWTLMLPDELAAVPPALWVTGDVRPDQPVSWLIRERVLRLLPHAPAGRSPAGARDGWTQMGEPAFDPRRSALVVPALVQRYGDGVLDPGPLRPPADEGQMGQMGEVQRWQGEQATAERLELASSACLVLEASVTALGGGRLAGLLVSPDELAARGDARVGVVPWHRVAELELPPVLILDRSRFDPGSAEGMALAAAATARAEWTLLSRWPLPAPVRERQLQTVAEALAQELDPASALATAQRAWLAAADRSGRVDLANPRLWAAFTVWGGP
jgi:tetratricopeptide (TPR) repeat protein